MLNKKKNQDIIEETNEEEQNILKRKASPKFMNTIYIIVIAFCSALLITMVILTSFRLQRNAQLKEEVNAIIEKYNIEANEHNNKSDPDYAEVYFDGNIIYIPTEDVIIEYNP